jgi:hypothetical protein
MQFKYSLHYFPEKNRKRAKKNRDAENHIPVLIFQPFSAQLGEW